MLLLYHCAVSPSNKTIEALLQSENVEKDEDITCEGKDGELLHLDPEDPRVLPLPSGHVDLQRIPGEQRHRWPRHDAARGGAFPAPHSKRGVHKLTTRAALPCFHLRAAQMLLSLRPRQ